MYYSNYIIISPAAILIKPDAPSACQQMFSTSFSENLYHSMYDKKDHRMKCAV